MNSGSSDSIWGRVSDLKLFQDRWASRHSDSESISGSSGEEEGNGTGSGHGLARPFVAAARRRRTTEGLTLVPLGGNSITLAQKMVWKTFKTDQKFGFWGHFWRVFFGRFFGGFFRAIFNAIELRSSCTHCSTSTTTSTPGTIFNGKIYGLKNHLSFCFRSVMCLGIIMYFRAVLQVTSERPM